MTKEYVINIIGCDDCTVFKMELTDEELNGVKRLCNLSKETSEYVCMPVIEIEEYDENDLDNKWYGWRFKKEKESDE